MMHVYRPISWKCPKCGMRRHTAQYIANSDTILVKCTNCHYREDRLPKDRVAR